MANIDEFLSTKADDGLVSMESQHEAARCFSLSLPEVEDRILSMGLLPRRYARNRSTITPSKQLILFRSTVAVAGCGGLGCYLVEELARLGIGTIIVIDPDVFEEHNLNRQIYSTFKNLGVPKVAQAASRAGEINPAITLITHQESLSAGNGRALLHEAQLVMDALDSIPARLMLAELCEHLHIPFVHGSIAGWYGQVLTQYPGERTLQTLYAKYTGDKGVEHELGIPAFTPAVVASLEVAEAVKVLLGEGTTLQRKFLSINLLDMEIIEVPVLD